MYQQSGKNLLNRNISTCPHNMCELLPSKGCVSLVTLGHRALQQILMGFTSWLHCFTDVARWRSTELCTMFGNLLVCLVSWCLWSVFSTNMAVRDDPGLVHNIYTFSGAFDPKTILPGAKFTFRPSLALSYIGSITVRYSVCEPNFAAWYKESC